jgi:hypothetical protein
LAVLLTVALLLGGAFAPTGGGSPGQSGAPGEAPFPAETESAALPQVLYDLALLPEPVARRRGEIIAAARTGDIDKLRPILAANGIMPVFSFGGDTDAIGFWKEVSGDGEGRELLAIMIEVFEAGFARVQDDVRNEIYVWPYFAEMPLDSLTAEQQVELYELVTAQDVKDMEAFGAYNFYRAGITPDGQWQFFVAGD